MYISEIDGHTCILICVITYIVQNYMNIANILLCFKFYAYVYRFLESHWFIWCTQFNHLAMEMDVDDLKDWPARQVRIQYNLNNLISI